MGDGARVAGLPRLVSTEVWSASSHRGYASLSCAARSIHLVSGAFDGVAASKPLKQSSALWAVALDR